MLKKLGILGIYLTMLMLFLFVGATEAAYETQYPAIKIVIGAPTTDDDFVFEKLTHDVIIWKIEGLLVSGGSVNVTLQNCNLNGAACSTIITNMGFNGGTMANYEGTDIPYPDISTDRTIKFITNTVVNPGYFFMKIYYWVVE